MKMKKKLLLLLSVTAVVIFVFTLTGASSQAENAAPVYATSYTIINGTIPTAKAGTFRAEQMAKPRVKVAYEEKWDSITAKLQRMNIAIDQFQVFIRGFKEEAQLECWVKQKKDTVWKLYTTYPICAPSGEPGPKRCQGDYQVPEGFYHVSVFNPYSNFYLSLGVSYPNASDKVFACKRDPGGAIMIHGNCVTIGCIPITDPMIKELYVLCVEAKNSGQKEIPIHLFPARLTAANIVRIKETEDDPAVRTFWDNLQTGYNWFETKKKLPKVTVDLKGNYLFS
jgi:murein L,D-transpeptidase YafK